MKSIFNIDSVNGISFGIKRCEWSYLNYDYININKTYFNERQVIRLVSSYYSVEGDMRIVYISIFLDFRILKMNPKESYRLCYISFILQPINKGLSMFC
ncbi:hypothetical protein HZS_7662 [Henneguya salminicola]|nr:hypothetical protein HZS_7662 [Henneguya salminicola]